MLESNLKVVDDDIKALIKDAQALFQAAVALSGEKADEARSRGMRLLDKALADVQEAKQNAVAAGKETAVSAEDYIKENPWRSIAVAAAAGLLAGVILTRK